MFNILGPLTNPAAPRHMVIGAFDTPAARLMAGALSGLEIDRAPSPQGAFDAVQALHPLSVPLVLGALLLGPRPMVWLLAVVIVSLLIGSELVG